MRIKGFRRSVLAACGMALSFSIGEAGAQSGLSEPAAITDKFTPVYIADFLREIGLTASVSASRNGAPVYLVEMPGGGKFLIVLTVCEAVAADGCYGLYLIAYFDPGAADPVVLGNDFDATHPFAKTYITARGTPVLARYLIADGGITKANLYYNLTNFLASAKGFSDALGAAQAAGSALHGDDASQVAQHQSQKRSWALHDVAPLGAQPLVEQLGEDLPADFVNHAGDRSAFAVPRLP